MLNLFGGIVCLIFSVLLACTHSAVGWSLFLMFIGAVNLLIGLHEMRRW
jgi:hypothetical protein